MKRFVCALTFLVAFLCAEVSFAMGGVIALVNDSKILIAEPGGWFSGGTLISYLPYHVGRGDRVYGAIRSYGSHTIYDDTADAEFTVYIEEIMMDSEAALDYFSD